MGPHTSAVLRPPSTNMSEASAAAVAPIARVFQRLHKVRPKARCMIIDLLNNI
jgi:hypothetical protein